MIVTTYQKMSLCTTSSITRGISSGKINTKAKMVQDRSTRVGVTKLVDMVLAVVGLAPIKSCECWIPIDFSSPP